MQEQNASTQRIASGSGFLLELSEMQHIAKSEYNIPENPRVVDWIPDPAAPSDPGQSHICDDRSPSDESSERSYTPVIDYKYRVHTKQLGHLYGLCDAVPYLLGTRSYLKAIVASSICPVPIEAYQDQEGRFVVDPNSMSVLDKIFLTMLWLLRISVDRRPAKWEESYAGMTIQGDRLIVYKDIGFGREPKVETMHFYDFVAKVVAWNQLPNPALVAEDRPDVVTPWAVVAQKIREKDIPLRDIDKGLYTELVKMTEPQLDARLMRLSLTDELEKRKRELVDHVRKLNTSNTFTYIMPQETNPNVMYAKRFSH